MTDEAKVGMYVVIVIIVFVGLSMAIGELSLSKKGTYPITMVFPSVEGLKVKAPLELAGVSVGSVESIALNKDYSAVVTVALNEDIKLPIDSVASISTKGILGDKIITIVPGVSSNTLSPGGNLPRTKIPPSVDDLLMKVGELAENLTQVSASLNEALGDGETMKEIVVNIRDLSANASSLLSENKDNISTILTNMREITNDFTLVSRNLTTTSENIDQITTTISSGQGTLGKLVQDDELYYAMVDTMESLQNLTRNMKHDSTLGLLMSDNTLYYDLIAISDNLKIITDEVASGRGTIGRLVTDDELYMKLKETVENANRAAQGIEEQTPITVMGTILGLVW
jgi:phospholipid/cholesterol/gamma-HCH transport system substrate-binding protein